MQYSVVVADDAPEDWPSKIGVKSPSRIAVLILSIGLAIGVCLCPLANMYLYSIQKRTLLFEGTPPPPTTEGVALVKFHLEPKMYFEGTKDGDRRFVLHNDKGVITNINANNGHFSVRSSRTLRSLLCPIAGNPLVGQSIIVNGGVLEWKAKVASTANLAKLVENGYYLIPPLLSVGLPEAIYIESVQGTFAKQKFRWELNPCKVRIPNTSRESLHDALKRSGRHLFIGNRLPQGAVARLHAALHYLHLARRLYAASAVRGEFTPAAILNLCKSLESLFPGPDRNSRERIKRGLITLGVPQKDIETKYLPAVILRSTLDVAHVSMKLLTLRQLTLLNSYVELAVISFGELFELVLEKVWKGDFVLASVSYKKGDKETKTFFKTLERNLSQLEKTNSTKARAPRYIDFRLERKETGLRRDALAQGSNRAEEVAQSTGGWPIRVMRAAKLRVSSVLRQRS